MSEEFNVQTAQQDAPEPKINIRELLDRYLAQKVISHFQSMQPLVDFLNKAIDA
jgi:hypothetical protein